VTAKIFKLLQMMSASAPAQFSHLAFFLLQRVKFSSPMDTLEK